MAKTKKVVKKEKKENSSVTLSIFSFTSNMDKYMTLMSWVMLIVLLTCDFQDVFSSVTVNYCCAIGLYLFGVVFGIRGLLLMVSEKTFKLDYFFLIFIFLILAAGKIEFFIELLLGL